MKSLDLSFEQNHWKRGREVVIGVDEAGRGPLAGPVYATAVYVRYGTKIPDGIVVRDSKTMSPLQREQTYAWICSQSGIQWVCASVSPLVIDRINILQATKQAMRKAVMRLVRKTITPNLVVIDGISRIGIPYPQEPVVGGDGLVFSCAIASIISKVRRDRYMERMHKLYSWYGFASHKGYGTKAHMEVIRKFGVTPIHRTTFLETKRPVDCSKGLS